MPFEHSDITQAVAELLRFQGSLQLTGLGVPPELLTRVAPMARVAPTQAPVNNPIITAESAPVAAATPPPATVDTARDEASRLIASLSQGGAREVAKPTRPRTVIGGLPPELLSIRDDIGDCSRCKLCKGRTNIVFGVGNPRARLMFIGEGPGRDEDLLGEPFVGAAGQLLDRMIVAMGLKRSDVYIANIVKCRPPKNRDPEPDEIEQCEPFLVRQIQAVQPEVIVALGRIATQTLLRDPTPISRQRGKWREYEGRPLLPTFHPAYLLRTPGDKKLAWEDLQQVMRRLDLKAPGR